MNVIPVNSTTELAIFHSLQENKTFNPKQKALIKLVFRAKLPLHPQTFHPLCVEKVATIMSTLQAGIQCDIQTALSEDCTSLTLEEIAQIKEVLQVEIEAKGPIESTDGEKVSTQLQKTAKKIAREIRFPNLKNLSKAAHSIAQEFPVLRKWIALFCSNIKASEQNIAQLNKIGRVKKSLTVEHLQQMSPLQNTATLYLDFMTAVQSIHSKLKIEERQEFYLEDLKEGNFLYEVLKLVIAEINASASITAFVDTWIKVYKLDIDHGENVFIKAVRALLNEQLPSSENFLEKMLTKKPTAHAKLMQQTLEEAYVTGVIDKRVDHYFRLNPIIHMVNASGLQPTTPLTFEEGLKILHTLVPGTLRHIEYSTDAQKQAQVSKQSAHMTETDAIFDLITPSIDPIRTLEKTVAAAIPVMQYLINLSQALS